MDDDQEGAVASPPAAGLSLNEFEPASAMSADAMNPDDKSATDLSPVFDVPVNISAVLGRASMSVADPITMAPITPPKPKLMTEVSMCPLFSLAMFRADYAVSGAGWQARRNSSQKLHW